MWVIFWPQPRGVKGPCGGTGEWRVATQQTLILLVIHLSGAPPRKVSAKCAVATVRDCPKVNFLVSLTIRTVAVKQEGHLDATRPSLLDR